MTDHRLLLAAATDAYLVVSQSCHVGVRHGQRCTTECRQAWRRYCGALALAKRNGERV